MFCFQCQETAKNQGCTIKGVCGKENDTANLQDLLIDNLKGIGVIASRAQAAGETISQDVGLFVCQALFTTITNANFDEASIVDWIQKAQKVKKDLYDTVKGKIGSDLPACATWYSNDVSTFKTTAEGVGILATVNEDVRSLRELLIIGLKGVAAYADHAAVLGATNDDIFNFVYEALASTTKDLSVDQMVGLVLKCGEVAVTTMATLDGANTGAYGNPELSEVNIGVGTNPGILISGHDLKDMEELLTQTDGTGVDVYTHGEMLPANYYPAFKKYAHLKGNYGGSWWHQNEDFEAFNGPILMTTNCVIPIKSKCTYAERLFTTGVAGYPGAAHIADRERGGSKDFSKIISLAKTCKAPVELETGKIVGGFAHNQVLALADKVVDAVKSGAIKRFVVMAGCDGRQKGRAYFTQVAEKLPKDAIILTAGCAKYRYNKLNLGDIGGIPRVLDAGQCNDCYSLAVIALKLKEVFGLDDINDLPISFDIGWYEQKAVAVLLALLFLGVKGIRLGPSLPAFVSPAVLDVLVKNFDIKSITDADTDIAAMMAGK
ncbi:MAG: hydroxylamine reductase [Pseudomonadota bacterium]